MLARTGPFRRRTQPIPGRLYATEVADSAHGICTQPLHAVNWSDDSGASDAPKSTVRAVTAEMPPPEPIGEYVRLMPNAEPSCGIHADTSGNTNELPAPVMVVSLFFVADALARPAIAATAITATRTTAAMALFI